MSIDTTMALPVIANGADDGSFDGSLFTTLLYKVVFFFVDASDNYKLLCFFKPFQIFTS